jgi:hypothetical protein
MIYRKGDFRLNSDFDIRVVRQEEDDTDLFIPIGNRSLNLCIGNLVHPSVSRLQFPNVRNLLIRFCADEESYDCTVHLLSSIDLNSSLMNFEIDYRDSYIELIETQYYAEMSVIAK